MNKRPSKPDITSRVRAWLDRSRLPQAINEVSHINSAIGTGIGTVRAENQDSAIIGRFNPELSGGQALFFACLCDGIGGMKHGKESSQLAIAEFVSTLASSDTSDLVKTLKKAVESANTALFRKFKGDGGTTIVGFASNQRQSLGFSVGDSRLYSFSPSSKLKQISLDDTIAGELSRLRGEEYIDVDADPIQRHLAQYVGMGEGMSARAYDLRSTDKNAYYIITSDGVHSAHPHTLNELVLHASSPRTIITRFIQLSQWRGGFDNATAICISPNTTVIGDESQELSGLELWDSFGSLQIVDVNTSIGVDRDDQENRRNESANVEPKEGDSKPRLSRRKDRGGNGKKSSTKSNPGARSQRELEIEVDENSSLQPVPTLQDVSSVGEGRLHDLYTPGSNVFNGGEQA